MSSPCIFHVLLWCYSIWWNFLNGSLLIPPEFRQMGHPLNHVSCNLDGYDASKKLNVLHTKRWMMYDISWVHTKYVLCPLFLPYGSLRHPAPSVGLQMETRCRLSHNFFRQKLKQNSNPLYHIKLMEFLLGNSNLTKPCGLWFVYSWNQMLLVFFTSP